MASIDTHEPTRDEHLRGPDFFDVERYPEARFESRQIIPLGGPNFRVIGDLTFKDITREVEFEAAVESSEREPWVARRHHRGDFLGGYAARGDSLYEVIETVI
ncbi:MAG: YceI family protein [Actinomycetota bacterium]|nr:YceI family protein [Actinomycetota bacterium]